MAETGGLTGKRILVVEDEYFIASDLRRALVDAGAEVLGPASDVERGLALIEGAPPDAAVLDVDLAGEQSFALADRLSAADTPILFLTGYDAWSLPDDYRATPRLAKPFATPMVVSALEELVATLPPA